MDATATQLPATGPLDRDRNPVAKQYRGKPRGGPRPAKEGKLRLVTREMLDQRTIAWQKFNALVAQIRVDCGDSGNSASGTSGASSSLSAVQLSMIESFAGLSVLLDALTVDILLGKEVDIYAVCTLASTMTRVGARLGLHRKAMDVSPSLAAYLDQHESPEPIDRVLQPGRKPPKDRAEAPSLSSYLQDHAAPDPDDGDGGDAP